MAQAVLIRSEVVARHDPRQDVADRLRHILQQLQSRAAVGRPGLRLLRDPRWPAFKLEALVQSAARVR